MIIIAPLPCAKKRIRLKKLIEFKNKSNEEVFFYGWDREKDSSRIREPLYESSYILSGGGFANKKARLMYICWFFAVLRLCLSFKKNEVVWAMGFETAFPALIISKIKGFKVIFDDADRFSYIFTQQNFLINIIKFMEQQVSKYSNLHVIPCFERYNFKNKSMFVLKNTPERHEVQKARNYTLNKELSNFRKNYQIIIYVNGWLTDTRGMQQIHELSKHSDLGILIAGRIDSDYIRSILDFDNVRYMGEVSSVEALNFYLYSDYVFTFYDPVIPINVLAESNKWGDAIEMKTPIIVNSEVVTSDFLRKANVCVSTAYNDNSVLYKKLKSTDVSLLKINLNKVSNEIGFFDDQLRNLFSNKLGN